MPDSLPGLELNKNDDTSVEDNSKEDTNTDKHSIGGMVESIHSMIKLVKQMSGKVQNIEKKFNQLLFMTC